MLYRLALNCYVVKEGLEIITSRLYLQSAGFTGTTTGNLYDARDWNQDCTPAGHSANWTSGAIFPDPQYMPPIAS